MERMLAFYDDGDVLYCVGSVYSEEEADDYARNYFLEYEWVADEITVDSPWEPYFDAEVDRITSLPANRSWGGDDYPVDDELDDIRTFGAFVVQITVRWEYERPAEL